jgi:sporulation protein YlmC with PRC-barrel domain
MTQSAVFTIGAKVNCSDDVCGQLSRVIIDPISREVTHLVVQPASGHGPGHLVPVAHLKSGTGDTIELDCSHTDLDTFESAEEVRFIRASDGAWGYQPEHTLLWPYYGFAMGPPSTVSSDQSRTIAYDFVPVGEVDIRRGERIQAADGEIGRVRGLVLDPADHRVTHVLVDEGHLWGKKRVAIPMPVVTHMTDFVSVALTKNQIRDLPEVDVDEWDTP